MRGSFTSIFCLGKTHYSLTLVFDMRLKRWQKLNNHYTSIIVFTGFRDDFTRECCLLAGIEEMITKPLDKETAKRIVKKYIKPKKKKDYH